MEKQDIKKERKDLYGPSSTEFEVVEVPEMAFLMIDGQGDPNTSASYREAVESLFAVSYAIKFASKKVSGKDYVVGPLEGLWWADDWGDFATGERDQWKWTMMVVQPEWITAQEVEEATAVITKKKSLPATTRLRFEKFAEGRSAQILHVGSYADEAPTLARLHHQFLPANGLVPRGQHHEIYLSDPRRTDPVKLKTILRQPVEKQSDTPPR